MIQAYNSWENRVYELEGGLICKFYRPQRWSRAAIADEHRLLADLHAAHIEVAPALACGELEGITFATFPKLEGEHVSEDPSDDLLEELGRLLAHLHDVGAARAAPHRPSMDPVAFAAGNLAQVAPFVPAAMREAYCERVMAIAHASEPLYRTVPTLRVHGDFHHENCLQGPRGLAPIDFDDMMSGPAVQDVWLIARPPRPRDDAHEQARRCQVVLRGYRAIRPFEEHWLELIPALRALRSVWMTAWISSRWFDPLFRQVFPMFGTDAFWQKQLARVTLSHGLT